jgi:hypothetical protein
MGRTLNRRMLLRGMLAGTAVGVGLPALEIFLNGNGTAYAADSAFPQRFGLFFWGNGIVPDFWVPEATGAAWELSPTLAPLASVKDVISVISGTSVLLDNNYPHWSGAAGILSGGKPLESANNTFYEPSIDQVIAAEIGGETRFRSLEFGAAAEGGCSHNGPHNINPAEDNPYLMFERVFGSGFQAPGDEPIIDPTLALRRSVLDAVMDDTEALKKRIGAADKLRLEQHLEGVRELELRLARMEEDPPNLEACLMPSTPATDYPDVDGRPQLSEKNRAMCDLAAMALACDQSRVFSNWFSYPVNNVLFPDASAGHHQLTHDESGDQPEVQAILLQIMTELAYQIESLRSIEEGDGTLLDNCLVMATTDVSLGRTHNLDDFPLLYAGSAGGALVQGTHYRGTTGENVNKALLSFIRAFGINRADFGIEENRVTSGLGDIEA